MFHGFMKASKNFYWSIQALINFNTANNGLKFNNMPCNSIFYLKHAKLEEIYLKYFD